jgi:hypothetical protein
MGTHHDLGESLMRLAVGSLFSTRSASVTFEFGPGAGIARIDGTVADTVAVEIESRVPKQIRGALLDLILHPYPKKLLLLLPVYTGNPTTALRQAEVILGRFVQKDAFRVVAASQDLDESIQRIRLALKELGVDHAAGVPKAASW